MFQALSRQQTTPFYDLTKNVKRAQGEKTIYFLLTIIYNMLTKLYLDTTNPKLKFYELFSVGIFIPLLISVLFHTAIYAVFANMVYYIFWDIF